MPQHVLCLHIASPSLPPFPSAHPPCQIYESNADSAVLDGDSAVLDCAPALLCIAAHITVQCDRAFDHPKVDDTPAAMIFKQLMPARSHALISRV